MPIRFLPNGVYEFDTVEEAMQFRALSSGKSVVSESNGATATVSRTPGGGDFEGFFKVLEPHQKELLRSIVTATEPLTTSVLAQQVRLEPGQVGPMLRHIRTKAERFHIDPNRLIRSQRQRINAGERPSKVYTTKYATTLSDLLQ